MGMTRRMQHYDNLSWQPWLIAAAVGAFIILLGIVCQVVQLVVSIRRREQYRDVTGDPWNGRTLEWSTPSPPPAWNYAVLPRVAALDSHWGTKNGASEKQTFPPQMREYQSIEMPKNSPIGLVTAFFAVVTGFALVWHIWWMAILGAAGAFATLMVFAFRKQEEVAIPASVVAQFDRTHPVGVVP
jgi:cytochrome o ubiquinol oxidase subunit 1